MYDVAEDETQKKEAIHYIPITIKQSNALCM